MITIRRGVVLLALVGVAVFAIGGLMVARRHSSGLCGFHPIPRGAVPDVADAHVIASKTVEPEGCGASYMREAVLVGDRDETSDALLDRVAAELKSRGWSEAECVTTSERCFERSRFFAAMTTPDGARRVNAGAYPASVGDDRRPQLLVLVDESRTRR